MNKLINKTKKIFFLFLKDRMNFQWDLCLYVSFYLLIILWIFNSNLYATRFDSFYNIYRIPKTMDLIYKYFILSSLKNENLSNNVFCWYVMCISISHKITQKIRRKKKLPGCFKQNLFRKKRRKKWVKLEILCERTCFFFSKSDSLFKKLLVSVYYHR